MAQVAATRSIQSSLLSPSSGSLQEGVEKLRPSSFSSKLLAQEEAKYRNRIAFRSGSAVVKSSARAEPEVVPVSPEDVPQVCARYLNFSFVSSLGFLVIF